MKPSDSPYKVLFQDPGLFEETVRLVAPMLDATLARWEEAKVAEGVQRGLAEGVQRGLAEGVERGAAQGRVALLRRQAQRRFGADVASHVATLLADVSDTSRLDAAGEWLVACDTGEALLERLSAMVRGAGNGAPS